LFHRNLRDVCLVSDKFAGPLSILDVCLAEPHYRNELRNQIVGLVAKRSRSRLTNGSGRMPAKLPLPLTAQCL
jgi:hypothetical protein